MKKSEKVACLVMRILVVSAFLYLAPLSALAHDFWIEPATYRPASGTEVPLRLRVGGLFSGGPISRPRGLIRFDAVTAEGPIPIAGSPGNEPAGSMTVTRQGLIVVAYQNSPAYVELTEELLGEYLREEGLEQIQQVRAKSPYATQPWREIYSRCAKALLWDGKGPSSGFDRAVGMPLELIPDGNPYTLRPGGSLPVRLLYRGAPLEGALIVAIPQKEPGASLSVRSDADGRVELTLPVSGAWLIKAVHIAPAPPGARGQWESFWASLTFELQ